MCSDEHSIIDVGGSFLRYKFSFRFVLNSLRVISWKLPAPLVDKSVLTVVCRVPCGHQFSCKTEVNSVVVLLPVESVFTGIGTSIQRRVYAASEHF